MAGVLRQVLDHRFTQAHASDYLDDELSEAGRRRVERHTSICPQCRDLIASLRRMLMVLAALRGSARTGVAAAVIERLRRDA